MKTAILATLVLACPLSSTYADDSVKYSPVVARAVSRDVCARAAVNAAVGTITSQIQEDGVDFPDLIQVSSIEVIDRGRTYKVTIDDAGTQIVQTKMAARGCRVIHAPSVIRPE